MLGLKQYEELSRVLYNEVSTDGKERKASFIHQPTPKDQSKDDQADLVTTVEVVAAGCDTTAVLLPKSIASLFLNLWNQLSLPY